MKFFEVFDFYESERFQRIHRSQAKQHTLIIQRERETRISTNPHISGKKTHTFEIVEVSDFYESERSQQIHISQAKRHTLIILRD